MIWLTIILGLLVIGLSAALFMSIRQLARFVNYAMKYEDGVNAALDIIDNSYNSISQLLDHPLTHESSEVKFIMTQLQGAKNAILDAAKHFAVQDDDEEEQTTDQDGNQEGSKE